MLHSLAALCLNTGVAAVRYVGIVREQAGYQFDLTEEQAEAVQSYVDKLREYADGGELFVEQRVPVGHITGEAGAEGTADGIVIQGDELQVHDAKFGRVRVNAERNPQTMLYALGALEKYGLLYDLARVRLVIHQPRIGNLDEWACTVDELAGFAHTVKACGETVHEAHIAADRDELTPYLNPGESQCHYCKAKPVCAALAAKVEEAVGMPLAVIVKQQATEKPASLPIAAKAVPLVRLWCNAVDEELTRVALAGEKVDGFKVVRGRMGNREWADAIKAEEMLTKSFRLTKDEAYTRKLISPTGAEEIAQRVDKKTGRTKAGDETRPLKPGQWEKLQALIARSPAPLKVVPVSDKREAVDVTPVAEHFADETMQDILG